MKSSDQFLRKKKLGERISMLTCYDYPTALWQEEAGVDIIFVGDSLGTNILGYKSEKEVVLDDMAHHLKAVRRGVRNAYLLVDLPYLTYETVEDAYNSASRLVSLGADGVKIEGFRPEIVEYLSANKIEVCGHLGLNPQLHMKKTIKAKTAEKAAKLISESMELQKAGAWGIVYELIPEEVGREATNRLSIPTIGIGAGRYTDGQVLVVSDLLGFNSLELKHVCKYVDIHEKATNALRRFVSEVTSGKFPSEKNVRHLDGDQEESLKRLLIEEAYPVV